MNEMNELIAVAKKAASPEELLALAKEEGLEITSEAAADYFAKLHPVDGELSDEELDNVSGGGCSDRGAPSGKKVNGNGSCDKWSCGVHGSRGDLMSNGRRRCMHWPCTNEDYCKTCIHVEEYKGKYYCDPVRNKITHD
jgi:hypothetical protein